MLRKPLAFALPVVLVAAIVGCGNKSPSPAPAPEASGGTTTGGAAPTATTTTGLKELQKVDTKPGKGDPAATGDEVWVTYTGKLPDGKIFDSTDKHNGTPFSVTIGQGQVIEGWEKGLVGMKIGGSRTLHIPWAMAYGETGHDVIPPRTDLTFDVTMVAIVKMGEEKTVGERDIKVGSGPAVKDGDKVTVDYTVSLPTGLEVSTTYKPHKPVEFVVGKGQAIEGMDAGVKDMHVGGIREMTIPPQLGPQNPAPNVPAHSVLIFKVELKKIG